MSELRTSSKWDMSELVWTPSLSLRNEDIRDATGIRFGPCRLSGDFAVVRRIISSLCELILHQLWVM